MPTEQVYQGLKRDRGQRKGRLTLGQRAFSCSNSHCLDHSQIGVQLFSLTWNLLEPFFWVLSCFRSSCAKPLTFPSDFTLTSEPLCSLALNYVLIQCQSVCVSVCLCLPLHFPLLLSLSLSLLLLLSLSISFYSLVSPQVYWLLTLLLLLLSRFSRVRLCATP